MEKRRLGRTDFNVSIIGFGGIPIQQCTKAEAEEIIREALAQGINFIDTARGYTNSEELIGNALKGVDRDKFYIATKTMGRTYEDAKADWETSFKNLDLEYIDLYQFHNLSKEEDFEIVMGKNGAMKFFKELKRNGFIREIGVTSHNAKMADVLIQTGEFSTIQFPVNAVENQGLPLFKKAKELDIGTIAMKPIAGGVLMNHGEESLRYILENEDLTVAIPGMRSVDEVIRNSNVGNNFSKLGDEERKSLLEEAKSLGTDFCRRCNYCQPCTVGINISQMFLLDLYLNKYDLKDWATVRYSNEKVRASDCIACGNCEARCPYNLPIIEKLKTVAEEFKGY